MDYLTGVLAFGDLTGDGKTDVFRVDGRKWYISEGGTGPWTLLQSLGTRFLDYRLGELAFGDFTGDWKADV